MFPLAIGAVVDGVPTTSQTPLSGQRLPVFAVVPTGMIDLLCFVADGSHIHPVQTT
jgi:hypothetical protein